MTSSPVCEFKGVTRRFVDGNRNVTAIDNFSLAVQPGEFIAIMGPSGSGKSSVLNLAGGLDVPTEGQVFVHGQNLSMLSVGDRPRCAGVGLATSSNDSTCCQR